MNAIFATSAPLPLCGKPNVPRIAAREKSFVDRSKVYELLCHYFRYHVLVVLNKVLMRFASRLRSS